MSSKRRSSMRVFGHRKWYWNRSNWSPHKRRECSREWFARESSTRSFQTTPFKFLKCVMLTHFICLQARVIATVALILMSQKNKSAEHEVTTPLRFHQVVEIATCFLGVSQMCGADRNVVRTRSHSMCSSKVSSVFSARSVGLQCYTQCWVCKARRPADFDDQPRVWQNFHTCNAFPGVILVLKNRPSLA